MAINNIKTYKVVTFGCQMNARDSEKIAGVLEKKGYVEGTNEEVSDIVIFNTCTVRENANMRLYGRVGHLKKSCAINKNKIVGICGCMMQEPDEVLTIKKKYPYVKLIFGTHNIDEFETLLDEVIKTNNKVIDVKEETIGLEKELPSKRVFDFKCGVNIMYGCNNFCTYCIVPYVRGRERSRTLKSILREIECDVKEGVKEVMLLGQNVNSYKGTVDDEEKRVVSFPELLDKVCNVEGLNRVRFMTSHPKDLSDDLIKVIKKNKNCCHHIHLPLQSGSNRILTLMNRHYTKERYLEIIDKIKSEIEDVAITTDVIVGFPSETEDDFNETIDIINKVKFDSVFTFEYSKRTGTKAAEMEAQVSKEVVKNRFEKLLKVVEMASVTNANKYVGKVVDILVESKDRENGKLTGRTGNNYLVHFDSNENLIGKIINVKLKKSFGFYFEGEMC